MAVSLTHTTVAVGTDAGNGEIRKAQWNENHTLTLDTNKLLGRATAGTGAVEEIDCTAAGRALLDDATAAAQCTTLGLGTGDSPQFTAINIGHASDTTLSRAAAGALAVEGKPIPYVFAQSAVSVAVGAVTTETALATITIPGGAMGPNGCVIIDTAWLVTANANAKTLRIRAGGIAGTEYQSYAPGATIVANNRTTTINNVNSQSSQRALGSPFNISGVGSTTSGQQISTVDTSVDWDLVISGQKASSGDTLSLEAYRVIICYGA